MSVSVLLGVVLSAGVAVAERELQVDIAPGVPFAAADLINALRMRVANVGPPIRLEVIAVDTGVTVSSDRGSRTVVLAEQTGPDAARLVALAVVDLALEDLETTPAPVREAQAIEAATPAGSAASAKASAFSFGVLATAATWSTPLVGGAVDLAIARGRWRWAFDVGGGQLISGPLDLIQGFVRAGGGVRFGSIDVRAGATLMAIQVSTGAGDRTLLVGASPSVRQRFSIGPGGNLVLALGADVFATRTDYELDGGMISTPWLTLWLGAGLELTP